MSKKHKSSDSNLSLKEAVDSTSPKSKVFAMAVVDTNDDDVFYSFNGSPQLLLSLLSALGDHIKNKTI